MILVDTNVIIAFWRSPTEKLKLLFEENHNSLIAKLRNMSWFM